MEVIGQRVRLVRPRSFAGLMTLYEGNHARLRKLLGNLWRLPSSLVSTSPTDLSIHLTLDERSRYTASLRMTYRFDISGHAVSDPNLLLRIYHDARLVEAVSCCEQPWHAIFKGSDLIAVSELERRWTLNILLSKWLEHCLDHRHVFAQPAVPGPPKTWLSQAPAETCKPGFPGLVLR
ncbi:MAG: DUF1249 domain-containing protein [Gammaproteobacteria bacterium]